MNQILAILSGGIIAVSVMMNGQLSAAYGSTLSAVMVHLSGAVASLALVLLRRPPKAKERVPLYLYCGGFIGVFTIYANIFTFASLGVSLTAALGLVGQCGLSLIIDTFGLFGLPRQRLSLRRLLGLGIILAGILLMMLFTQANAGSASNTPFSAANLVLAFIGVLAGASIVCSRMLSADLAARIGVGKSTLINYITGSALSVLIFIVAAVVAPPAIALPMPAQPFMYFGGLLGVVFVAISNQISLKLSALVMTLLVFISQQAVGIALDGISSGVFPAGQVLGALLLVAGLLVYIAPPANSVDKK